MRPDSLIEMMIGLVEDCFQGPQPWCNADWSTIVEMHSDQSTDPLLPTFSLEEAPKFKSEAVIV